MVPDGRGRSRRSLRLNSECRNGTVGFPRVDHPIPTINTNKTLNMTISSDSGSFKVFVYLCRVLTTKSGTYKIVLSKIMIIENKCLFIKKTRPTTTFEIQKNVNRNLD